MRKISKRFFLCIMLLCLGLNAYAKEAPAAGKPDNVPPGIDAPSGTPAYYLRNAALTGIEACRDEQEAYLGPLQSTAACITPDLIKSFNAESPCGDCPEEGNSPDKDALPDVPVVVNNSVDAFLKYFQTGGRDDFEKWLQRTGGYQTLIEGLLRQEGLPEELFYVAMIESGLNPRARSRGNAVGMWQFIKATGVRYGLRIDWWIDERRDPEKSTLAAARFLKRLYGRFDSWYLAMAGYNAGEGRIRRAVKRHRTYDFWKLAQKRRALKRETRRYVPKYLAAMIIAKEPEAYGFHNLDYAERVEYTKVKIPHATDIKVIASAAGISLKQFKRLNPELIRWFTPPDYSDYEVRLPPGSVASFKKNFKKVPRGERLKFYKHRVKPGDTLWAIARKYRTRIKSIQYLNNIKNPKRIRPGKLIVIPVRAI